MCFPHTFPNGASLDCSLPWQVGAYSVLCGLRRLDAINRREKDKREREGQEREREGREGE